MDFIGHWSERAEIGALQLVAWIGLSRSKFYSRRDRYGKANEHNALVPRDHWLEPWEQVAVINFHHQFPLEGYRRLSFMMLDRDVVAVSPSSTYRGYSKPLGFCSAGSLKLRTRVTASAAFSAP
jgi:hypothetical protein